MLQEPHFNLLRQIAPASFFDLRQHRVQTRALLFRTRMPFRSKGGDLVESPYVSKALPFTLAGIMSGSAQVGFVIYYPAGMSCELAPGMATISTASARKGLDLGEARPIVRSLSDLMLFDFNSRNALVAVRVDKKGF